MSDDAITRNEILSLIARLAALSAVSYFTIKWLVDAMDPTRKQKIAAEEKARKILRTLGIRKEIKLTDYELIIASQLVDPASINTSWKDIAGLDHLVSELKETVILPIQKRDLLASSGLTSAPKGVLLHGPPGCGKTMIAKATAKEAGAQFINLDVSSLTDKWYGESQKISGAVFSLAQKIQPCIIFIDEIDSLLRSRNAHDHEATAMIKAQFMQCWDGLISDPDSTVIIMGATNRPKDVDRAIIRRMPATFHVGLPDIQQRKTILCQIMKIEKVGIDVDYNQLAKLTEHFSGSDLRELCRTAAVNRIKDLDPEATELRPIKNDDLLQALRKMKESKVHCGGNNPPAQNWNLD